MEVGPLSCGVILPLAQLLSTPLQCGIRFFHLPIPADPSASLAARFPCRETYGFTIPGETGDTTFRISNHSERLRLHLYAGGAAFAPGQPLRPGPDFSPFWSRRSHALAVISIFRLSSVTTLAVVHMC